MRTPRLVRGAAALVVGLVALAPAWPVSAAAAAAAAPAVTRLSGSDPAGTAAAVSAATFPAGVSVAYVATSATFADALAGGAAIGGRGPILFADRDGLPAATATELHRLAPKRVVVLGGANALSDDVVQALDAYTTGTVTRLSGADRYDTAAAISAANFTAGVAVAYVATGVNYPDALAAGALAAGKAPVLLVGGDVPTETAQELSRVAPKRIVVLGGSSAVSDQVVAALGAFTTGGVTRLAGSDRFATASDVAGAIPVSSAGEVFLATATRFTDALVAVPAAVHAGAPLLLSDGGTVAPTVAAELARRGATNLVAVGDTAALSDAALGAAAAAAFPIPPSPAAGAATAVATAKAQEGKAYAWGGAGPDSFDCSGLTRFAWAPGSVSLPHNALAQRGAVAPVPLTQLQPGDLVFFGTDVHHVGLYVGNGTMVEAAHSGVPVRESSIWRSDLFAAGRPH